MITDRNYIECKDCARTTGSDICGICEKPIGCTHPTKFIMRGSEEDWSTKKKEMVNHPSHYGQGGVECIEGLKAATVGLEGIEAFCTANAIKYLWRWKYKNGVEDLDKAIWYINYLKENLK